VSDDRFNKQFDLEPTEYRKSDVKEPFWGFNAAYVGIMLLLSLPIGAIASWLVTGQFPYWLR
jgi:hypothetical protein